MRLLVLIVFLLTVSCTEGQRVVIIETVPENTPVGATLYLAGDPNDWNPASLQWSFIGAGTIYSLQIPETAPDVFEGKITRGSWATVEGNQNGGFLPNRTFNFTSTDTIFIEVLSWEGEDDPTDLPENLEVFNEAFFMPQLNRSRRIRVLLPEDYDQTNLYYPVLYMHDGQNLFSGQEAAFGQEWEIDEAMQQFEDEGYEGAIIVAIDNGGASRVEEYTPYSHPQYGGGSGDAYVEFIVNTLKPAIDDEYRTLPGRETTGIMGSSLGGLISFYAGIKYQDVFSKVGVFSPSFWFSDSIYTFADETGKFETMRFFFLAGGQEGGNLIPDVEAMLDLLGNEGFQTSEMEFQNVPEGEHSEWFWAQEFPGGFDWLYLQEPLGVRNSKEIEISLYPNPTDSYIYLKTWLESINYEIYDVTGNKLFSGLSRGEAIDVGALAKGIYFLKTQSRKGPLTKIFIKCD